MDICVVAAVQLAMYMCVVAVVQLAMYMCVVAVVQLAKTSDRRCRTCVANSAKGRVHFRNWKDTRTPSFVDVWLVENKVVMTSSGYVGWQNHPIHVNATTFHSVVIPLYQMTLIL